MNSTDRRELERFFFVKEKATGDNFKTIKTINNNETITIFIKS